MYSVLSRHLRLDLPSCLFAPGSPPQICVHLPSASRTPHSPPISSSWFYHNNNIWWASTDYEANMFLAKHLLLSPSQVQKLSSTSCSLNPLVVYFFRHVTDRVSHPYKTTANVIIERIPWIESTLKMRTRVFWEVMLCPRASSSRSFEGLRYFILKGEAVQELFVPSRRRKPLNLRRSATSQKTWKLTNKGLRTWNFAVLFREMKYWFVSVVHKYF